MTTKKDYEKVAKALHRAYYRATSKEDKEAIVEVVSLLSDVFKEDNPRFDVAKFAQAVYLEVSHAK